MFNNLSSQRAHKATLSSRRAHKATLSSRRAHKATLSSRRSAATRDLAFGLISLCEKKRGPSLRFGTTGQHGGIKCSIICHPKGPTRPPCHPEGLTRPRCRPEGPIRPRCHPDGAQRRGILHLVLFHYVRKSEVPPCGSGRQGNMVASNVQ